MSEQDEFETDEKIIAAEEAGVFIPAETHFVTRARTRWPAALAEIKRLRTALGDLQQQKDQWEPAWHDAADYSLIKSALNGEDISVPADTAATKVRDLIAENVRLKSLLEIQAVGMEKQRVEIERLRKVLSEMSVRTSGPFCGGYEFRTGYEAAAQSFIEIASEALEAKCG